MPFRIGSNGVLSLQEELASSFPSNFLFHVRATDCANKNSDDDAVVRVTVKNQARTVTQSKSGYKGDCKIGMDKTNFISATAISQAKSYSSQITRVNYIDDTSGTLKLSSVTPFSPMQKSNCQIYHTAYF